MTDSETPQLSDADLEGTEKASFGAGCFWQIEVAYRELDGVVKLVLKGKPYSLFTITQLDRVFEIFDSVDEAVATFSA